MRSRMSLSSFRKGNGLASLVSLLLETLFLLVDDSREAWSKLVLSQGRKSSLKAG